MCAVILTVILGTLIGCSIAKEDTGNAFDKLEKDDMQKDMQEEMQMEQMPVDRASVNDDTLENRIMLTFLKEGEEEQKQVSLVTGDGYSIYLPDDEWRQSDADLWTAAVNEQVRLWIVHYEGGSLNSVDRELADDGYVTVQGDHKRKQEGNLTYHVGLKELENAVWGIFYCYPADAEEGWGRELPVIADTFAPSITADDDNQPVMEIPQDGEIYGYISKYQKGFAAIDQQIWATPESADWKPEYNYAAGFEVVDARRDDIVYLFHRDCTYSVLENHHDPVVELDEKGFEKYLLEMEYPVLWTIRLEEGQIKEIREHYVP